MKLYALPLVLICVAAPARAVFLNYSQWADMPPDTQVAYLTGFTDALTSVASDGDEAVANHYQKCLSDTKIGNRQLTTNVLVYGSTHPKYQRHGVGGALLNYLIELCGRAP